MANAMLAVNFVPNKFGRVRLEQNGYQYMVKTTRGDRRYWKCIVPLCPATINTHYDTVTKNANHHSHPASTIRVKAEAVLNIMRERCMKETTPIPTIYEEERAKLRSIEYMEVNPDHDLELPTYYEKRMSLYRARHKDTLLLPITRIEVNLEGKWTQTSAGEQFLFADDGNADKILIFYHHSESHQPCSSRRHLWRWHLLHISNPVFSTVHTARKAPQIFFTDFEIAIRNSAQRAFANITLRGCFFHFTQCIWRKTQNLGLATAYKNNEDLRLLVRCAAVLPLVPPQLVEDVWFTALEDAEEIAINTTAFADYVTEYWVEGYNRQHWNHFSNEGPRTNNHLEGWHSKLKKHVNHAHPNIYILIEILKKTQANTEANQIQVAAGGTQRPTSLKYRNINNRLQH
ncbi:Hypothetical predicted protein [Mytilus galloprovincialis]|uniref:FLYWCH-type domain-containing protein n=1 Tax=Mytilus galloprovincialis TaxID=29158 RepID=A0A8B6GE39_MYTGA|nr:Hypothetical predicted protein [Mytilus galloprovincialis]